MASLPKLVRQLGLLLCFALWVGVCYLRLRLGIRGLLSRDDDEWGFGRVICYAFLLALPGCHRFFTSHCEQVALFHQLLPLTELDNVATYALSLLES